MSNPDTEASGEYASPACLAHEVDLDYMGLSTSATTSATTDAPVNQVDNPIIEPVPGKPKNSGLVAALRRFLARW